MKTGEGDLVYAEVVEDKKGSEEAQEKGEEKKPEGQEWRRVNVVNYHIE